MPVLPAGLPRHLRRGADRPRGQPDRPLPRAGLARCTAHPVRDRHPHPRRPLLGRAPGRRPAARQDRDAHPQPGARHRHAGGRRRIDRARQAAPARHAHAGPHGRFHVPDRQRPRLHGRHAADRRHRSYRPAHRRSGRAACEPVRSPAQARSGAEGLPGARLQGPIALDHRRRTAHQPAAAAHRARSLRANDEGARPVCPPT